VFAISQEVRRRILAGRLASPEKVRLLHPGVDVSAYTPGGRSERMFFVPGRIMWTKNLELAIEAFRTFRMQVPEPDTWRLCIAGIVDAKSRPYLERLQHLAGGDPAIEFHVRPDDRTMRGLYASAFAMLFTAFNEDWGLVILEAMASGVPPIACDRGGPREIVRHEQDGLLVDGSPGAMAAGMLRLVQDPQLRNRLAAAGPDSARRYDWSAFVNEIDEAIDRAVDAAAPIAADAWRTARVSE
jgi:glycosyltransferase involved in cell wall biosynthesis